MEKQTKKRCELGRYIFWQKSKEDRNGLHVHAPNSRLQSVTKECVRVCEFKFHVVKLSASA